MSLEMSTRPTVSICIPTYNRARYLRCLLESFVANIHDLTHSHEILISDNASTDNTESVVAEFSSKLNIRYIKRPQNYGAHDNWQSLRRQVNGLIQLYVADDDELIFSELSLVIDQMLADPDIGVVFAPWELYDRVGKQSQGLFYKIENDMVIEKNRHEQLFDLILQNHIFPEIFIIRSDLAQAIAPFTHPLAYWAFVQIAEYNAYSSGSVPNTA